MLKISDGNINIKKHYVEQGKDALSYSLHGIFAIGTSFRVMCFISELVLLKLRKQHSNHFINVKFAFMNQLYMRFSCFSIQTLLVFILLLLFCVFVQSPSFFFNFNTMIVIVFHSSMRLSSIIWQTNQEIDWNHWNGCTSTLWKLHENGIASHRIRCLVY